MRFLWWYTCIMWNYSTWSGEKFFTVNYLHASRPEEHFAKSASNHCCALITREDCAYVLGWLALVYLLFFVSRQDTRKDNKPATATGCMICLSQWYGHRVSVPFPRCTRPWARRTQNRLFGSLAWYAASWRNIAPRRALFVPVWNWNLGNMVHFTLKHNLMSQISTKKQYILQETIQHVTQKFRWTCTHTSTKAQLNSSFIIGPEHVAKKSRSRLLEYYKNFTNLKYFTKFMMGYNNDENEHTCTYNSHGQYGVIRDLSIIVMGELSQCV